MDITDSIVPYIKPNPKWVGEVTESAITTELLKRKLSVSKPVGDNQRYDLILDYSDTLWRVQCKTLSYSTVRNSYSFRTMSTRSNSIGWVRSDYIGQIDLFMTWTNDNPLNVYVIPIEDASNGGEMKLCLTRPNRNVRHNWHENYLLDTWLSSR